MKPGNRGDAAVPSPAELLKNRLLRDGVDGCLPPAEVFFFRKI